jgi:hypothetical protein
VEQLVPSIELKVSQCLSIRGVTGTKKSGAILFLFSVLLFVVATLVPLVTCEQTSSYYSEHSLVGSGPVAFTITIDSPTNKTAYSSTLPLDFILNWTAVPEFLPIDNWTFGAKYSYAIDKNPAITIAPNSSFTQGVIWSNSFSTSVSISNMANGQHKIAILALLYFGQNAVYNQTTTPVSFSVQNPTPTPTPTPKTGISIPLTTVSIFAVVVILVVVIISLLLLRRNRKSINVNRPLDTYNKMAGQGKDGS